LTKELTTTLLVNPVAGRGRCARRYPAAARALLDAGIPCDVVVSQYPGHIAEVSSDRAARGHHTVIVCGGDGTVNEVASGVGGTETAVGIIPLGISNNFAADMGIGKDIGDACKIIARRQTIRTDIIRVNEDKLIVGTGCLGFEAEAAAFATARRKDKSRTNPLGFMGGLLNVFSFQPKTVELRFNEIRYFGEALVVTFSPQLSPVRESFSDTNPPAEGLNLSIVPFMPKWKLIRLFSSIRKKGTSEQKGISLHRTRAVHVQSVGHVRLYADGDFVAHTPFRLQVIPKHLTVIANLGPA
jgi:diacylglycerol kinase (ATP)